MIKIMTDTASDISLKQAARMDVEIVPLQVSFGDEPYEQLADDANFTQFYTRLEATKALPTTSQISPAEYLAHFVKARQQGDDVIVIALSGGLSGTCQSARLAAQMAAYDDRIFIVDSLQAIIGQRLLVDYAVRLRAEGKSAEEIYHTLTEAAGRVVTYGALDTLRYLRKGGRIPRSAEVIGSMLGVKPLIKLEDGIIGMAGRARGHAGAVTQLLKLMGEKEIDQTLPVYFGYTQVRAQGLALCKVAGNKFGLQNMRCYPVGGIVGTHVGPGGIAVAFMGT